MYNASQTAGKDSACQGRVIVFAGTTEGFGICRYLADHGISVLACVATEYGKKSLEGTENLEVLASRLDDKEMEELFTKVCPRVVVDATHPYAAVVTDNIRTACEHTGCGYVRLLRAPSSKEEQAVYVDSVQEAAAYLEHTQGNILVATGSKELAAFTAITDYQERVFARVLSLPAVAQTCANLGFEGKHLICMQGPFSQEMNEAMLRQYHCRYLVTKDSGKAGGFLEKYQAALNCGAVPVIIGRPKEEEGLSYEECVRYLREILEIRPRRKISLVGIGMGSRESLTIEAWQVLKDAQLVIGARRMVDAVKMPGQAVCYEYESEAIARYLEDHPEYERIAVALSGDVGFYSGARKLSKALKDTPAFVCGVSSVVYFMAKIGLSWEDAAMVSAHGRSCDLVSCIRQRAKVFSILGTGDAVAVLAQKLVNYGLGQVVLYVGECLSYPQEKIFHAKARELTAYQGNPLSVVCAVNPSPQPLKATHGIADKQFLRGGAPMTKEEIRAVSLAKLGLDEDSVCYDVGAGTGSVSVEMALRVTKGRVYAIEKKDEAAALIRENKQKFAVDNLTVISGCAPEALKDLEAPTHAFIGGSSGNLKEIMACLLEKNPNVRMVINCITLETVAEAAAALRELELSNSEIVQVSVSRAKVIGNYHMMMGENPIYIISCER